MKRVFRLHKDKCALLVIDMQRQFCEREGPMYVRGSPRIIRNIRRLLVLFSENRRPIIFTRHIDSPDPDNLMLRWWDGQLKESDPMSEITNALDTSVGEIMKKPQYDAFLYTPLEEKLRAQHIKQVAICGVLTNCCCETTARSAFMRGFEVYFITDATGTFGKDMHNASLLNLSYGFATLMTVQSTINAL